MSQGFNNIKNIAKTGLEYSPYIGDAIDIGEGLYQATHGHPWLGTGQAALGVGGMAANLMFPGAGSVGKAAVKGAVKGTAKKAVTKAPSILEKFARWNRSGKGIVQSTALPNVGYWVSDQFKNPQNNTGVPFEILDDNQLTGGKGVQVNKKSGQASGQPTAQAQALALAQQLGGNPPITNQQEADVQQANIDAINDYVSKLQEINQPYLDALKGYLDNYDNLYNQNQLASRRLRDISAITGDPIWYQSSKDYNPMLAEANKVELQKKVQEAQSGDLNAINEIMGNLAMAQEMGLPPEAAFANKNLLTMMAARDREANRYQIALENNLMKKYGIDRNYARALTVQAMRGQNALDVASMYTGAYGNGGGVVPGLNRQGTANNAPASYDTMLQSAHNKNNR
jgi:hypothetical protein